MLGTRSHNGHQHLSWPLQKKLNSHSWKGWNITPRTIYCCTTSSIQLKKHFYLQRWLSNRFTVHRYQYSPTADEVFEYKHPAIVRFYVNEQGTSSLVTVSDTNELCDSIPIDPYPIHLSPINSLNSLVSMNQSSPIQPNFKTLVTIYSRCLSGSFY